MASITHKKNKFESVGKEETLDEHLKELEKDMKEHPYIYKKLAKL